MSISTDAVNDFLRSLGFDIDQIDADTLTLLFERIVAVLPAVSSVSQRSASFVPQAAKHLESAGRVVQRVCETITPMLVAAGEVYDVYRVVESNSLSDRVNTSAERSRSTPVRILREGIGKGFSDSNPHVVNREPVTMTQAKKASVPVQHSETPLRPPSAARPGGKAPEWIAASVHSLQRLYQPAIWLLQSQMVTQREGERLVLCDVSAEAISQLLNIAVQNIALRGGTLSVLNSSVYSAASHLNLTQQRSRNVRNTTSVQQQNTYNIYGSQALEIASEVELRQHSANARIMRANQNGIG